MLRNRCANVQFVLVPVCVQTTDAGGDRTAQGGGATETCGEDDG